MNELINTDIIRLFKTDLTSFDDLDIVRIISGHINVTYCVTQPGCADTGHGQYIFQRINHNIFRDPEGLMRNIQLVTEYVYNLKKDTSPDPERSTLVLMPAVDGKIFARDSEGYYWRCYQYLRNSVNLDMVKVTRKTYLSAGSALAEFQKSLMGFDASQLVEVIPDFHNTVKRFENLKKAVAENRSGRASDAKADIDYALSLEKITSLITDGLKSGEIPLRVTHNDTKFSNIMIDRDTKEVLCFIDLDTVMPGSALYDFGDALRAGGSSAAEDEADLSKVHFVPANFRNFCRGYLSGAKDFLTPSEIALLPESVAIMTYECGIRFLSDYLDGDVYFHTSYPEHNLVRARNQFKLVSDILGMLPALHAEVNKLLR